MSPTPGAGKTSFFPDDFALPKLSSIKDALNSINREIIGWALDKHLENIKMEARLDKTANDIIKDEKAAKVRGEFPGEFLDKTLREIEKAAKSGNRQARKAKKLLNDKRFNKGDNRK